MNGIAVEKIIVGISLLSLSSILQITSLALKLMSTRHAYQGKENSKRQLENSAYQLLQRKFMTSEQEIYSTRTHVSSFQRHSVV